MAKKTVTKADLVNHVADVTGMKKKDVKAVIDAFLNEIAEMLDRD